MIIRIPKENANLYAPRIENIAKMQKSAFKSCYLNSERCVEEIVSQQNKNSTYESNNIIAFTGDRGSGKTSTMMNFARILEKREKLSCDKKGWDKASFLILPLIEPTHISENETVLDVILSRLYTEFCKWLENPNCKISADDTRQVYKLFDTAFDSVRAYCKSRETRHSDACSLEALNYTVASNNIKENMKALISKCLEVNCKGTDDGYLVILVDDVDMNISQGYSICEDLRKYFSFSKVIILFSFKESQLTDIIRQEYLKFYSTTFELGDKAGVKLTEDITDIAAKYIDKLIPFNRKCAMPQFNISNISVAQIQYGENNPTPLVDEILRLFYDKTGILLVKNRHNTHPLIPTNLRGIIHLIKTLNSMESITLFEIFETANNEGEKSSHQKVHIFSPDEQQTLNVNLVDIHRYFLEISNDKLDFKSASILNRIAEEPLDTLNKSFARLTFDKNEKVNSQTSLRTTRSDTLPENVDFRDMIELANEYCERQHFADGKDELFIELLLALYSTKVIRLLFDKINSIDDFIMQKGKLYKVLGEVFDIDKFSLMLRRENHIIKGISDNAEELDMVLMHTFYVGEMENNWKSRIGYARYEYVDREHLSYKYGNTFAYFSMNAMMCITNSLSANILIESDRFKAKYEDWLNKYIGILPLFSLNATYQVLKSAPLLFVKQKEPDEYNRFVSAIRSQLIKSLDDCSISNDCRNWLNTAAEEFPFWEPPIHYFLNLGHPDLAVLLTNNPNTKRSFEISRDFSIGNINRSISKYENNIDSWAYFKRAIGVDRRSPKIQKEHSDFLLAVNENIKEKKKPLLRLEQTDENLHVACSEISDILKAAKEKITTIMPQKGDVNAR